MIFSTNVTEQDLINLAILAEKQKNQWAVKIINWILEENHIKNLAESFEPILDKLKEAYESTKKLEKVFKKEQFLKIKINRM